MVKQVRAIGTAAGFVLTGTTYFQSGASFRTNYETPDCLTAIASAAWTHGILQDLSTGATGAAADHITYGNLLAKKLWDANPMAEAPVSGV